MSDLNSSPDFSPSSPVSSSADSTPNLPTATSTFSAPSPLPPPISVPPSTPLDSNPQSYAEQSSIHHPSSPPFIKMQSVIIALIVVLVVLGGVMVLSFSGFIPKLLFSSQPQSSASTPSSTPAPSFAPLAQPMVVIQPLLEECLFRYAHACVQRIASKYINQDNQYEKFASADIPFLFSYHFKSAFPSYKEGLSPLLLQTYFPELAANSSSATQPFTAADILQHIAQQENINPRVLLALMEVFRNGQGPLLGGVHPSVAFFDTKEGFAGQTAKIAQELKAAQLKYFLLAHDEQLPRTLQFFGKTYTVDPQTKEGTLAITEVLSKHMRDRNQFERALVVNPSETVPENNFVSLYTKLFQVDPLTNADVPQAN